MSIASDLRAYDAVIACVRNDTTLHKELDATFNFHKTSAILHIILLILRNFVLIFAQSPW